MHVLEDYGGRFIPSVQDFFENIGNLRCQPRTAQLRLDTIHPVLQRQPTMCSRCKNKKVSERHSKLKAYFGKRQSGVRANAQTRSLEYALPDRFLLNQFDKQQGLCFYTGIELQYVQGQGTKDATASVDRIDNSVGYVPGNVVLCSYKANSVKRNLTLVELKTLIPSWYHRLVVERLVDDETGQLLGLGQPATVD